MMNQESKGIIAKTTCPLCGKEESILISESEISRAKQEHKLIAKAMQHAEEEHILALHIDIEGRVRRRYCFDIVETQISIEKNMPIGDLEKIFTQMVQNSRKIQDVIQSLAECPLIINGKR